MTWGLAAFILVLIFGLDWMYDWHLTKKRVKEWQDLKDVADDWRKGKEKW